MRKKNEQWNLTVVQVELADRLTGQLVKVLVDLVVAFLTILVMTWQQRMQTRH